MTTRTERTRLRILEIALRLFAAEGYDAVPVTRIADEAGVSHMTFFRHFPSKSDVVVTDPYDPLIAEFVRAQPAGLSPLERGRRGILEAWSRIADQSDVADDSVRLRLGIVATHPGLRARMWESQQVTQQAIAAALADGGTDVLEAEAVAGALIGALTSALFLVGAHPTLGMGDAVAGAMRALDPGPQS
ncbi:TetR/AcrR family transcriptional regulator [Agilicoccus flavus]|uniref:TetR/AcrR family transcriptional regulator n=1 Tax=Agilicoccus flavus TaxID=2775968 RepID=UPI001CF60B03|nr:TetR/AcrR family transcriptional regulator [Agilicoccus flavus]